MKKQADMMKLELIKTPDILASVAALSPAPFTVGFVAETEKLESHARTKLFEKGVDVVAANDVTVKNEGFESEHNRLLLIDNNGVIALPRQYKTRLARTLIQHIAEKYHAKGTTQNTRFAHR